MDIREKVTQHFTGLLTGAESVIAINESVAIAEQCVREREREIADELSQLIDPYDRSLHITLDSYVTRLKENQRLILYRRNLRHKAVRLRKEQADDQ